MTMDPSILERYKPFVSDEPPEYYRYYDEQVKYLPLKDKGLKPELLGRQPDPVPGEYPEAKFIVPAPGKAPSVSKVTFPVELLEEDGVPRTAAVRFGFPVAETTLFDLRNIAVLDPAGNTVPAQFAVLGSWPDGSVKWVLV